MTINKDACVVYIDWEHSDTFGINFKQIEEVPTEALTEALKEIQQELNKRKVEI